MGNTAATGPGWSDAEEARHGHWPELPANGHVGAAARVPRSQRPFTFMVGAAQARVFPGAMVARAVAAQQLGHCP